MCLLKRIDTSRYDSARNIALDFGMVSARIDT